MLDTVKWPDMHLLDRVVGLHGSEEAIVEGGHEEALRKVVQMLPHCQDVVTLPPRAGVQTTALHAGTEAADGVTLWQLCGLLQYS